MYQRARGRGMTLRENLRPGEEIVARVGPYYATSHRVLRYDQTRSGAYDMPELPYSRLSSIELVRPPNHKMMAGGTVISLGGVFLTVFYGLVTTILLALAGLVFIVLGSMGKGNEPYFQLHIADASSGEQRLWRVPYRGSMEFMAAVGTRTGKMPAE